MAENIVSGLFGISPEQVSSQQRISDEEKARSFSQMSPFERSNYQNYLWGAQIGRGVGGMLGMQDPQAQQAEQQKQIQSQIDHSTPEGLMQGAQLFNQAGNARMAYMYQQAATAKERELAEIGLKKAQAEKALQPPKEEPGAKYSSALGKLVFERSQFPADSEEYRTYTRMIEAEIAAKRAPAVKAETVTAKPTKGQESADREFGKEYVQWKATGGYSDVEKQLKQLENVSSELAKPGNDYTGPVVGNIPDRARALTNPAAVAAKNMVEEVAQRNLRLVLGAQFTQVEGERLIARAYNPMLPPAENKRRVDALIRQIRAAAQAKEDASQYFEANGTLSGWKGKIPSLSDFEQAIESAGKATEKPQGWSIRKKQ